MLSRVFGRLVFAPTWIPTLATGVLLLLSLSLSHWQWQRAELKTGIMAQFTHNKQAPALSMHDLPDVGSQQDTFKSGASGKSGALRYRMTNLTGHYLHQDTFFLDNKIHNHVPGFHVITPFMDSQTQKMILVDRGFIPQSNNRLDLPTIFPDSGSTSVAEKIPPRRLRRLSPLLQRGGVSPQDGNTLITVQLELPPAKTILLGANEERSLQDSRIVQTINLKNEQKLYNYPLKDYLGLLQSPSAAELVLPEAAAPYLTPERHLGYAVQWLGLGLALLVIYITANLKRREQS